MKSEVGLRKLPTIVYTGKQLTRKEEAELKRLAETIIIKDVRSLERLLDETALFLHRVTAQLPESRRKMLETLHRSDPVLAGRKVLVVDDDVRNIFALTTFLERSEMKVVYAENGRDGIARLQDTPEIDVVLMDIMMPEMDGYETMRAIRAPAELRLAADHRADRQGDEGRPREVHRGGRVGLHRQAGGHRPAAVAAPRVAVPMSG